MDFGDASDDDGASGGNHDMAVCVRRQAKGGRSYP